jgi:hypothetical protein
VIRPAEADVVGPAVAPDDPDAPPDQRFGHRLERSRLGRIDRLQPLLEQRQPPEHDLAALAVGLLDRPLDLVARLIAGQEARQGEEEYIKWIVSLARGTAPWM